MCAGFEIKYHHTAAQFLTFCQSFDFFGTVNVVLRVWLMASQNFRCGWVFF